MELGGVCFIIITWDFSWALCVGDGNDRIALVEALGGVSLCNAIPHFAELFSVTHL